MIVSIFRGILAVVCLTFAATAKEKEPVPQPAPVPTFSPAQQPVVTGEFVVGIINITFKETAVLGEISESILKLGTVSGISQEEYFKIYSNDITWPKMVTMPDEQTVYQDPHLHSYFLQFNLRGFRKDRDGWGTASSVLADRIRAARKGLGLTQKQAAKRLGITKGTFFTWEAGSHRPSGVMMRKLSEFFGIEFCQPGNA